MLPFDNAFTICVCKVPFDQSAGSLACGAREIDVRQYFAKRPVRLSKVGQKRPLNGNGGGRRTLANQKHAQILKFILQFVIRKPRMFFSQPVPQRFQW